MINSIILSACQAALHDQQTIMPGGTLMQSMRRITSQVHTVADHCGRNPRWLIPILPPILGELALINNLISQPSADIGEICVSINCPDGITRSHPAGALQPVDPVQALHDPDPAPARSP